MSGDKEITGREMVQKIDANRAGVTSKGLGLAKNWLRAQERVRRQKLELEKAEKDLAQCADDFADWILPPDRKVQEKISVWIWDSLFSAELVGTIPAREFEPEREVFNVEIRYAGSRMGELLI